MAIKIRCGAAMAALVLGLSGQAQARERCAKGDEKAVTGAVERFLAAVATGDQTRLAATVSPDFLAFDGGKQYSSATLAAMVGGLNKGGATVRLSMHEPRVRMGCDMAWVAYVNKGVLTTGAAVRNVTWLESTVVEMDRGDWRVTFSHATIVPAP